MSEPLLAVRGLNVWFGSWDQERLHAVRDVTFSLSAGDRLGLVGDSGCGKSTTLLALMGLLTPDATVSGEVILDGHDILAGGEASVRKHRWRNMAMVFQGAMNALNPVQTIRAQVAEPIEYHDLLQGRAAQARADELLRMVGLPGDAGGRYPHELSGGMRQRVAIAMALACQAKILLADEPTTALDVMVQAQILRLLSNLADTLGLAVVLVTHDLSLMGGFCSRAAMMYAGELVETGAPRELFQDPRHPYTRLLRDATPDLFGDFQGQAIPGSAPRLDRPIPGCAFEPRCDRAFGLCKDTHPELEHLRGGRSVACHLNSQRGPE